MCRVLALIGVEIWLLFGLTWTASSQARNEEELPECMLTILHIHKKDLRDAWDLAKLQQETDKSIEAEEAEDKSSR